MGQRRIKKRRRNYTIHSDWTKSIPMTPEVQEVMEIQFAAFRKKFGRDPRPDDPIFFDPDADEPRELSQSKIDEHQQAIVQAMQAANIRGELIYAYQKTGRLVTDDNLEFLTDEELKEWEDAIEEYRNAPQRS